MAVKKAEVFILDVAPSMRKVGFGEDKSYLDQAKFVLFNFFNSKLVAEKKGDHTGLVLVGTDETNNDLAEDGQYEHISVYGKIDVATISLLKFVDQQLPESHSTGDVIDAIIVAADLIAKHCLHYKFEKKIYILTNAESPINREDPGQIIEIIDQVRNTGIAVDIIGFGFNDNESQLEIPGKSDEQKENEDFLREFASKCSGDTYLGSEAVSLLSKLRSKSVKPTTLIRSPLTLGDKEAHPESTLEIPVYVYAKTMELKLPSAKKLSSIAETAAARSKTMEVVMDRVYKLALPDLENEELDKEVKVEDAEVATNDGVLKIDDLIKGYKYGKTIVPFSKEDEESLRLKTTKELSILAFPHKNQIRREWYMSNILLMVPDPTVPTAVPLFSAFLRGLQETNCYALIRYVFRDNSQPKLMLLMPPKKNSGVVDELEADNEELMCYGLLVQVPYADDIREFNFPSLFGLVGEPIAVAQTKVNLSASLSVNQSSSTGSSINSMAISNSQSLSKRLKRLDKRNALPNEAIQIMDDFIDAMDLTSEQDIQVFNPGFQRLYQCISHRAINPTDNTLPEQDQKFIAGLLPRKELVENAQNQLDRLKKAFNIEKVDKKSTGKRIWAQNEQSAQNSIDIEAILDGTDKKVKLDDPDISILELTQSKIDKIGTMDPVGDFEAMIARRDTDLVDLAVSQMCSIIVKLVTESLGDTLYSKAMQCLSALRNRCIIEGEVETFNNWMVTFRDTTLSTTRFAGFRLRLVDAKVTLIDEEEGRGGVKKEVVEDFLRSEDNQNQLQEKVVQPVEEEDEDDL
ncbi:X-ray repair cross-complementing protein 5, partial [Nowakowskiella sp. JEL0078]